MRYIDMHCDTLAKALMQGKRTVEVLEGTMADLRRLKKSGAKAQFFAMFLPQKPDPGWRRRRKFRIFRHRTRSGFRSI